MDDLINYGCIYVYGNVCNSMWQWTRMWQFLIIKNDQTMVHWTMLLLHITASNINAKAVRDC